MITHATEISDIGSFNRNQALNSNLLWGADDLLKCWFDLPPPRNPYWLRQAGLDEQSIQLLTKLCHAAVCLLRDYLHRLFMAQALPHGSRAALLVFLGRVAERQVCDSTLPAGQLLAWINSAPKKSFREYPAWRMEAISGGVLARFESAPPKAQHLLFMDLQLRSWLGSLGLIPGPERSRFFGAVLKFFTEPPSQLYPVYPLPQLQLLGSAPGPGLAQPICAQHPPLSDPSKKDSGAESGRSLPAQRSHGASAHNPQEVFISLCFNLVPSLLPFLSAL